ncbi:MAG: SDR family NAD(P)-dependent oxidoreductase [Solirubrobacterales bacterium]|nr:SDR family NAD(P)-dependent oxidoreductase [Solirubrobacterales bacterium]MBV9535630.1 SDR family NAD(P)-dependent oxidoreductase [Solirubrobacterales bacterium]
MTLVGGNVLITGATGGIGRAIARAFARRGAALILTGRRADVLEALVAELGARALSCDLSRRDDVERLIAELGEIELDVLVANAGLPATGVLADLPQEKVDRLLEVNLRAPIALARGLAPGMIERRRGHMVFVSSLSGKAASASSSLYCATKFGLRGFALSLREDLRPHRVGVSVLLPGFIRDAGMFADSGVKLPPGVGTRTPEQVAAALISAVQRNRAEVEVAPATLRVGATIAGAAPGLAATAQRLLGGTKIGSDFARVQRSRQ